MMRRAGVADVVSYLVMKVKYEWWKGREEVLAETREGGNLPARSRRT